MMASGGEKQKQPYVLAFNASALERHQVQLGAGATTDRKLVGCGQSWLSHQIMIVNPVTGVPSQPHEIGEIWLAGHSVAQGYWQDSEKTQATFGARLKSTAAGPFLRTGDLGFIYQDELFVTGRLKDVLIIRGRNHYPQDLEITVQNSHTALTPHGGAVFTTEIQGEERLIVVQEVERRHYRSLKVADVSRAIRQHISQTHHLQVQAIRLLKPGTLPKTTSGKVKRHACKAAFLDNTLVVIGEWNAPEHLSVELAARPQAIMDSNTQEGIETWLIARLCQYLKVSPDELDPDEMFSALGMDSSVAMSVTGELEEWLDIEIEPNLFWEYPSIASLAKYLEATKSNAQNQGTVPNASHLPITA